MTSPHPPPYNYFACVYSMVSELNPLSIIFGQLFFKNPPPPLTQCQLVTVLLTYYVHGDVFLHRQRTRRVVSS